MSSLSAIVLTPPRGGAFAADAVRLIEDYVHHRPGLRGLSLKAGLGMLKAARPDLLPRAVERLLPEFLQALEPMYQECRAAGRSDFGAWLHEREAVAAAVLVATADQRVDASSSATVKSNYKRFRGMAEEEVRRAMPAIAGLVGKYV